MTVHHEEAATQLKALLATGAGRQVLDRLADGQGTDTEDGKVWLKAAGLVRDYDSPIERGGPPDEPSAAAARVAPTDEQIAATHDGLRVQAEHRITAAAFMAAARVVRAALQTTGQAHRAVEKFKPRPGRPLGSNACALCGFLESAGIHHDKAGLQSTDAKRLHNFQPR